MDEMKDKEEIKEQEEPKGPVPPPIPTHEIRAEKRKKQQKPLIILGAIASIILIVIAGYLFLTKPKNQTKVVASKGASETVKKAIASKQTGPGRIVITRLKIDEAVLDDGVAGPVTQDALLNGVNYYDENTNVPGKGNLVLFGHSAVSSEHGAPFGAIGDGELKVGDTIVITDAANKKFTYVVTETTEIASTDFSYVRPIGDEEPPVLTIITCVAPDYPKDKRLAVRATLK